MIRLLILADDFTGALDTAVQFAQQGAKTLVTTSPDAVTRFMESGAEVVSVDLETRHLPPDRAREIVRAAAGYAAAVGIPYLYKKLDSTLRGNVGCELEAVLEAFPGRDLMLAPAFPKAGRTVRDGVLYVGGVPLSETAFAKDPFNPILSSDIREIIRQTSGVPVVVEGGPGAPEGEAAVHLYDAETDEALRRLGDALEASGGLRLTAGSAGFAAVLAEKIAFEKGRRQPCLPKGKTLIVCGSVHPVSLRQIEAASSQVPVFTLPEGLNEAASLMETPEGARLLRDISGALDQGSCAAVRSVRDTSQLRKTPPEEAGVRSKNVADNLGALTKALLEHNDIGLIVVFGGDTLHGIMARIGCDTLEPVVEILPGTAVSRLRECGYPGYVATKAGGFGGEDLIEAILRWRERASVGREEENREAIP